MTEFDLRAEECDAALDRGLRLTGEDKQHFARRRIAFLAQSLDRIGFRASQVMDFGCGTGDSCLLLRDHLGADQVIGVDASPRLVAQARETATSPQIQYSLTGDHEPDGQIDLVYCNGVFHHIPPGERPNALRYIRAALRPSGLLALWDNNPWNPATRLVMSRIPFDRDAIPISPLEALRLLRRERFEVLRLDFLFLFPRALAWLRPLEQMVHRLPLGAQYQALCRRG